MTFYLLKICHLRIDLRASFAKTSRCEKIFIKYLQQPIREHHKSPSIKSSAKAVKILLI